MKIRAGLLVFIAVAQSILFLTHLILYETWTFSISANGVTVALWLKVVFGVLSVSFLGASLVAWRYTGAAVRAIYKVAAVWLGLHSFLFIAAVISWLALGAAWVIGLHPDVHLMVEVLFGAAAAAGVYGVFNA